MPEIKIELANEIDNLWGLLLSADPYKDHIEEYINQSKIYIARLNEKIAGVYALYHFGNSVYEIKNIAVSPEFQNQGIAYQMLLHAQNICNSIQNSKLSICTGNSSKQQISLYKKAGFEIINIRKGFFIENYPSPVYENGIRCVDQIVMQYEKTGL